MTIDMVANWGTSVRASEYNFLPTVLWAVEQAQGDNWNALAKLLCLTHGKEGKIALVKSNRDGELKGDRTKFAEPLKRILSQVLVNVSYKFAGDKDYGVVFKRGGNWGFDAEKVKALHICGKVTIKDSRFAQAFPKAVSEKKVKEPADAAKHLAKYLKDNGLSLGDVLDLVRAEMA